MAKDPETKKKKQIILILILAPILVWFVYSNLIVGPKKKKQAQAARPPAETVAGVPEVEVSTKAQKGQGETAKLPSLDEKLVRMQDGIAEKPWGRDPFNPAPTPVEEAMEATDWKLDGVIPHSDQGAAFINGELIGVGETYQGFRLIKVESYRATLEKGGQLFILTMPEE